MYMCMVYMYMYMCIVYVCTDSYISVQMLNQNCMSKSYTQENKPQKMEKEKKRRKTKKKKRLKMRKVVWDFNFYLEVTSYHSLPYTS